MQIQCRECGGWSERADVPEQIISEGRGPCAGLRGGMLHLAASIVVWQDVTLAGEMGLG